MLAISGVAPVPAAGPPGAGPAPGTTVTTGPPGTGPPWGTAEPAGGALRAPGAGPEPPPPGGVVPGGPGPGDGRVQDQQLAAEDASLGKRDLDQRQRARTQPVHLLSPGQPGPRLTDGGQVHVEQLPGGWWLCRLICLEHLFGLDDRCLTRRVGTVGGDEDHVPGDAGRQQPATQD